MREAWKRNLGGCLCAVVCEALFGLSYLFTKDAAMRAGPWALLGWRFAVAAATIGLCAAVGIVRVRFRGRRLGPLWLVAACSPCAYFVGETLGIARTTASESAIILACIPVAALVASSVALRKRPTWWQAAGIGISMAGILTATLAAGATATFSAAGYAFLGLAVAAFAGYAVSVEKAGEFTGAEITFAMLMAGAALFVPVAVADAAARGAVGELLRLPMADRRFLVALLYQGIGCSVFAFFLSNRAIALIGVNRSASFIGVATLVGIVAGILVLGEPFGWVQGVGAGLVVAGVLVANAAKAGGAA